MAKNPDIIKTYDRGRLTRLWASVRRGSHGGFPRGKAFEFLLVRAFELDGARVTWPFVVTSPFQNGGSQLSHQIDGVVYLDGLAFLLESKQRNQPVPFPPIAYLQAHLRRRPPVTMGLVFALKGVTDPAREALLLSGTTEVLLWEADEVDWAFKRKGRFLKGLREKLRWACEKALPDYNVTSLGGA
ncbi:MAG: hypothetical protein ACOZQL_23995 [Myxococcota bacterium]